MAGSRAERATRAAQVWRKALTFHSRCQNEARFDESFVEFEKFGEDYGSEHAANGVWKKIGDGIIDKADVDMDPVSLDKAKCTDLATQVQTKPLPQKQQIANLSIHFRKKSILFHRDRGGKF